MESQGFERLSFLMISGDSVVIRELRLSSEPTNPLSNPSAGLRRLYFAPWWSCGDDTRVAPRGWKSGVDMRLLSTKLDKLFDFRHWSLTSGVASFPALFRFELSCLHGNGLSRDAVFSWIVSLPGSESGLSGLEWSPLSWSPEE